MTRAEAAALWRILTILAGWDEIIDVAEVEPDLDLLLRHLPDRLADRFDETDVAQIQESLRAQIECNLVWHEHANLRRVEDVPGCEGVGIT